MSNLFQFTRLFDQDISKWDVSNVISMSSINIPRLAMDTGLVKRIK